MAARTGQTPAEAGEVGAGLAGVAALVDRRERDLDGDLSCCAPFVAAQFYAPDAAVLAMGIEAEDEPAQAH